MMNPYLLGLLPPLDHLEQRHGSVEVAAQLEHLFVGDLVVLPVLPRLHLLRPPPERDVGVGAGARNRVGGAAGRAGYPVVTLHFGRERALQPQPLVNL